MDFQDLPLMNKDRTDIFLAGDSTMCFYTRDRFPRTGWGMALPAQKLLDQRCTSEEVAAGLEFIAGL